MRTEIQSAADFLLDIIQSHNDGGRLESRLSESQLAAFHTAVCECLTRQYKNHWFPATPLKGSGYRCIRINGTMDPLIAQAGKSTGMPSHLLCKLFPSELTMWVNPAEVSYRIGENGSICVLYEDLSLDHLNATMPCPVPNKSEIDYCSRRASWPVTDNSSTCSSSPLSVTNFNSSFYDSLTSMDEGDYISPSEVSWVTSSWEPSSWANIVQSTATLLGDC